MSSTSPRIDPGTVVGPYLVQRKLAQGGMSVLYIAQDPNLDREVVLKMIPDELATPAARVRLLREARALGSVEHPGIVRVYGTGEHEGTPWIAMELVRGTDLKKVIAERGPVSMTRALRWVAQVADALSAAHDAGVIHRDLKPSNILLASAGAFSADEQIKVVDFGIAKRRIEAGGDVLTSRREVVGTPAYLSPEQLEHGLADERSDVWALGCVLYELVVGTPPFGRSGSATTIASILRDEPDIPAHVSSAVRSIIMACLRKSSFARVGSARELASLVRDALGATAADPTGHDRASERSTSVRPGSRPSMSTGTNAAGNSGSVFPDAARGPARPSTRTASTRPPPSASTTVATVAGRGGSAYPPAYGSTAPGAGYSSNHPGPPRERERPTSTSRLLATRPPVERGRMKGTAIRAGLAWYAGAYGASAISKVCELSSPELRAIIRETEPAFGIIASGWYDTLAVGECLEHMEAVAAPDDVDEYTNALTAAIAKDNVSGIYKSLFRLIATPELLEANVQRVWQTYCDEGTLTAQSPRAGELVFALKGVARHHAKLCVTVGYAVQNVLREVGFAGLVVERTQCVADGHPYCGYEGVYLP